MESLTSKAIQNSLNQVFYTGSFSCIECWLGKLSFQSVKGKLCYETVSKANQV